MWAIMKAYKFEKCIKIDGESVIVPPDCPQRFIPVFDTRDQALAFAGGDDTHLAEMEEHTKNNKQEQTSNQSKSSHKAAKETR